MLSPILPPVSFLEISELELPSVGVVDEGLSVTVADASDGPLCLNSDPVGRGRDVARVVPKTGFEAGEAGQLDDAALSIDIVRLGM